MCWHPSSRREVTMFMSFRVRLGRRRVTANIAAFGFIAGLVRPRDGFVTFQDRDRSRSA
jgi:hypothetical protein